MSAQSGNESLVEIKATLRNLICEHREPLEQLKTCLDLAKICNDQGRDVLVQHGVLSCLAKVLNESVSSLASVAASSEVGTVHEMLVKFIMQLMGHFANGSALCIRKFCQYNILYTVLSAVDCHTSALYTAAVSGLF